MNLVLDSLCVCVCVCACGKYETAVRSRLAKFSIETRNMGKELVWLCAKVG